VQSLNATAAKLLPGVFRDVPGAHRKPSALQQ